MAEVIYTAEFECRSSNKTKTESISVSPPTVNTKQQIWDEFVRSHSLSQISAYNNWEIVSETFSFKNPPWSNMEELKSNIEEINRIKSVTDTIHSRQNHKIIKISVPKYASQSTIENNLKNYFQGLQFKSNYPGTTIVIVSAKRYLSSAN